MRERGLDFRWALALVLVLALVVRLAVAFSDSGAKPVYDAKEYDDIARSIADHGRYPPSWYAREGSPAALRPPAYPYALGVAYEIGGKSVRVGKVLGALLGTVAVGLIALIALRLWGRTAALLAGLLAAVYPPLVMTNGSLTSEALFVPLVLGLVLVLLERRDATGRAALAAAAAAGVLCGLATLTRPVGLVLLLPAFLWAWRLPAPVRGRVAPAGVAVLLTALTVAPWTVRNQQAFDTFVPLSTQDGFNLAGTYNDQAAHSGPGEGSWQPPFVVPEFRPLFSSDLDEEQVNRRLRDEAVDYATAHPGYVAEAFARNSLRLFGIGPGHVAMERIWYTEMGIPEDVQPWVRYSVYLMTLLALVGIVLRRREVPALVWMVPVLMLLSVAFIHGGPRYRVPIDPFLVLFAAAALSLLVERRRRAE